MEEMWTPTLTEQGKVLEEACPPITLVEDRALLSDANLQQTLLKNPHRGALVGHTNALNASVTCISSLVSAGFPWSARGL